MRSWRDPAERDEPRSVGRSHRGADGRDGVHYDRGDYSSHRRRFDRNYADDDEEEDGKQGTLYSSTCLDSPVKGSARIGPAQFPDRSL